MIWNWFAILAKNRFSKPKFFWSNTSKNFWDKKYVSIRYSIALFWIFSPYCDISLKNCWSEDEKLCLEKSLKMTSMRSLIIFTVTLILFKIVGGWQYERPQDWPGICQRGQSQSPVNLEDEIYQVFFLICMFILWKNFKYGQKWRMAMFNLQLLVWKIVITISVFGFFFFFLFFWQKNSFFDSILT